MSNSASSDNSKSELLFLAFLDMRYIRKYVYSNTDSIFKKTDLENMSSQKYILYLAELPFTKTTHKKI